MSSKIGQIWSYKSLVPMSRMEVDWVAEHRRLPPGLASWKVVRKVVCFVGDTLVSGLVDRWDGYLEQAFESVIRRQELGEDWQLESSAALIQELGTRTSKFRASTLRRLG